MIGLSSLLHPVLNVPILFGWMNAACLALALAIIAALWVWRKRPLRLGRVSAILAVAVAVALLAHVVGNVLWRPFADGFAAIIFVWVGLVVLALAGALGGPRTRGGLRRAVSAVVRAIAVVLVGALSVLSVNAWYQGSPTVGALLGFDEGVLAWGESAAVEPHDTVPLDRWEQPANLPAQGQVVTVPISASDPHFHPRDAYVYLPPAVLGSQRPELPVLVMMAGMPGEPSDWVLKGNMPAVMDDYAAHHRGVAPVVVVIDQLGDSLTNTLCSDTPKADAATYVEKDVPEWIRTHLDVVSGREAWGIGGLSNGGTCALQALTRSPEVYGNAVVLSGELNPTLGKPSETIPEGYGGSRDQFHANDPLTLMDASARAGDGRYHGTYVAFAAGTTDRYAGISVAKKLEAGANAAGIDTSLIVVPGAHMWGTWSVAFERELPGLADRLVAAAR